LERRVDCERCRSYWIGLEVRLQSVRSSSPVVMLRSSLFRSVLAPCSEILRWPDYIDTEHGARMLQNSLFGDQVAKTAKIALPVPINQTGIKNLDSFSTLVAKITDLDQPIQIKCRAPSRSTHDLGYLPAHPSHDLRATPKYPVNPL
jgi:hypothetical protein